VMNPQSTEGKLDRREFLRRSAVIVGAFVLGVVGAERSHAIHVVRCCGLCLDPADECDPGDCVAMLAWGCRARPRNLVEIVLGLFGLEPRPDTLCVECYSTEPEVNETDDELEACEAAGCANVTCSTYQVLNHDYPSPC